MLSSTLAPSPHSVRADHLAEITVPSPAQLLGAIAAIAGAEIASLEQRGNGILATLTIAGDGYRVQLDPLGELIPLPPDPPLRRPGQLS